MTKNSKRKLLFITLLLIVLLVFSARASLVPTVRAAEPSVPDKTISILNDVVGISTKEYATILNSQLDNQYLSLPQKEADIHLVSNQSSLRVRCSFVNNNLRLLYLSDYEGALAVKQPATNTVEMAKGFLERYQNYAGDSFYGELASMLDNVDVTNNTTKSAGNIKLEVLNSDNTILDYVWTYTDKNGIVAKSKNVILSYDRGQLKVFLNNWPLYTVTGTPKLSSEEAIAIALNASKNLSWTVDTDNGTLTVSDFKIVAIGNTTLSYLNSKEQSSARGGDPFTLYPSWYVPLGFDKFYPGGVTGLTIAIWADTGEVISTGPMVFGGEWSSSTEKAITTGLNPESTILSAPIVIAVVFSVAGVSLGSRKRVFSKLTGNRKLFSSGFWGTLLCVSILFSLILVAVPKVNATLPNPDSKSMIYASMHDQITEEQNAAVEVCNYIQSRFNQAGYDTTNLCGAGTTRSNVMSYAQSAEEGHHRAAVFHFGHLT